MTPASDSSLSPLWGTATVTVSVLLANSLWQAWFSQADGTAGFALMLMALLGWPLTTGLISLPIGWAVAQCEERPLLRLAVLSGVCGATLAVYGAPRLWNVLVCAAAAITVGLRLRREAQDAADLESL